MKVITNLAFAIREALRCIPLKRDRFRVISVWILSITGYICAALYPTIQMWITDGAIALAKGEEYLYSLVLGGGGLAIITIQGFIARTYLFAQEGWVQATISDGIYSELLSKITRIQYRYFDQQSTYSEISRLMNTVPDKVGQLITWHTLPPFFGAMFCFVFSAIQLFSINAIVAIMVTIGNLLSIVFYYRRMKDSYFLRLNQMPEIRRTEVYWGLFWNKACVQEIKAYSLFPYLIGRWKSCSRKIINENNKLAVKYSVIMMVSDFVSAAFKVTALVLTVNEILKGNTSIGSFMLVFTSISLFQGYLHDLSRAYTNISESSLYVDSWRRLLALNEDLEIPHTSGMDKITIDCKNVYFKYTGAESNAVAGINVTIHQGERIAIVGANGSGKSTFVALLNGLYAPTSGSIEVNGMKGDRARSIIHQYMMTVFQEFGKYQMSVRDNIYIGDREAVYDENRMELAVKKAGAEQLVSSLSHGLSTFLGKFCGSAGGRDLSGGEWQRIALARVFYRHEARILILDEPASSLDPYAEADLLKRFADDSTDQTVIMISHRMAATKYADRILVFEHGRIIEEGTHEELMAHKGLYFEMYESQASVYNQSMEIGLD